MIEKTGMLEVTQRELDDFEREKQVSERLRMGWGLQPRELEGLIKAGEYRVINTPQTDKNHDSFSE